MVTVAWCLATFALGCFLGHANGVWKEKDRLRRQEEYLDAHDGLDD
ncbi:membrane protein [Microbacterium phage Curie]